MANYDHADNIGTHPAYSKDPETALRARVEAAERIYEKAETNLRQARLNLDAFLLRKEIEAEQGWHEEEVASR